MRTVWLLLQVFAARWKSRRNMVGILVLIMVMISTFCYVKKQEPQKEENPKIVLGVAKEDSSEYAEILMNYFKDNEDFLTYVDIVEEEEQKLQQALGEGKLDAYLVIPKDFADRMIQMENLPIRAKVSMENPTKALVLRHVMEAYETYIEAVEENCTALYRRMREEGFSEWDITMANMEISMDLIYTALGKDSFFQRSIIETELPDTLSFTEHYQYTLVYFVLLFSFIPAGLQVLRLRKNGMSDRLRAMHISAGSIWTAVGIPYVLLSIAVVAGVLWIKEGPERIWNSIIFILPWLFVFLLFGQTCKEESHYLFLCCMILICLAVLGGSLIPEEFLPDSFQKIAAWMPNRNFTYVMGGVQP